MRILILLKDNNSIPLKSKDLTLLKDKVSTTLKEKNSLKKK